MSTRLPLLLIHRLEFAYHWISGQTIKPVEKLTPMLVAKAYGDHNVTESGSLRPI